MITITFNLKGEGYPKVFKYFPNTKSATSLSGNQSTQQPKVDTLNDFLDYIDTFIVDDMDYEDWESMKVEIIVNVTDNGMVSFHIGKDIKLTIQ